MDEENRHDTIADALRPVLEEGEGYNVYCHEGEIHVKEAETSVCAVRHPRLYGRLLSFSAQIDQASAGLSRFPVLAGIVICAGLHLHWWDGFLGRDLAERLDHWLFFVLVFYIIFQGVGIVSNTVRRNLYRAGREEVFFLISKEQLDRDLLLAMIEGDPAIASAAHQLKLDTDAPRITPQEADRG